MEFTLFAAAGWGEGLLIVYAYVFGFWMFLVCLVALLAMILRSPRISLVAIGAFPFISLLFQPWIAFWSLAQTSADPDLADDYKYEITIIVMWLFTLLFVGISLIVAKYRDRHVQLPPSETL